VNFALDPGILRMFQVLMALVLVGGTAFTVFAVGDAVAKRIKRGEEPLSEGEIAHLQRQAALVDELRDRVAELEERVDFTERLLTDGKGGGGGVHPASPASPDLS